MRAVNRLRVCDAAVAVLRETDNPAVMWGDGPLLYQIAKRAGLSLAGHFIQVERRVLQALTRQPGILRALHTRATSGRLVRIFRLPD